MKDRKDYGAFGDETATAARVSALGYTTAEPTRKGYTGYEKDAESSLEFAQARYYSTTHGRYTSVDPLTASASIKNPQTFNRYTYVLNSPYKYTDPSGLMPAKSKDRNFKQEQWRWSVFWSEVYGVEGEYTREGAAVENTSPEFVDRTPSESTSGSTGTLDDPSVSANDPTVIAENSALGELFTSGEGTVVTVNGPKEYFYGGRPTHYRYSDGQIIAMHIRDKSGNKNVNVYVPSGDEWEINYIGKKDNTVEARNKITNEVIRYFHIKGPKSRADLTRSMKTTNAKGWRLIGQTGGAKGNSPGNLHACIKIYKSPAKVQEYVTNYSTATGTGALAKGIWGDSGDFFGNVGRNNE